MPHTHDPASGPVCGHALHACHHYRGVPTALSALLRRARSRKPLPASTVGTVPGTSCHATARYRRHPLHAHLAQPLVRLASGSDDGATGDIHAVATPRFWTVPALA